tara:strand:+ start:40 stop:186 length:147 start_codon:yes stop_codon:yes gene_type:complete
VVEVLDTINQLFQQHQLVNQDKQEDLVVDLEDLDLMVKIVVVEEIVLQ